MSILHRAREVFDIEIEALAQTRASLGESFEQAVELMLTCLNADGKIVLTGVGKSLQIAEKIASTLLSTGVIGVVLNPTQAMHGDLGLLREQDLLLALSCSGESDELLACARIVKRLGIPIITITGSTASSLAACSDIVVPIRVSQEACPFNMAPTASTTATLAVGDALAMVLLDLRGLCRDDYAKLHPAGAIGRALLCRACDIMRSGHRLAVVSIDASVRDALVAMTGAKAGAACVTDHDQQLAGIFTDGDLRRQLTNKNGSCLEQAIADCMTRQPVTVSHDRPAADVLAVFESHPIDDLPVLDAENRLIGCIDSQDLPRMKIL